MVCLRLFAMGVLLIGSLWGCSGVSPARPSLASPLFTPTAKDMKQVAVLTQELDNRGMHCVENSTCEQVHYARAVVSLFENQEAASASFRRVIHDNPSSALSASSRLWLHLIEDEGPKSGPMVQLMAQFARDWMTRELTEQATLKQASDRSASHHTAGESSAVVQALQKQVRERERRIAILQLQIEDLKVIDQDQEKRKRTIKLPAALP